MSTKFIPGRCYASAFGAIIKVMALPYESSGYTLTTWNRGGQCWGVPYEFDSRQLKPESWQLCEDPSKEPAAMAVDAEYRIVDTVVCKCGICHAKFADGVWGTVSRSQS